VILTRYQEHPFFVSLADAWRYFTYDWVAARRSPALVWEWLRGSASGGEEL